jgi:hypothetical protein
MKIRNFLVVAACFFPIPVLAQPVVGHLFSIGVMGGGALTDAFASQTTMGVDTQGHTFSGSKDYVVGAALEVRLPLNFSVEFDALYRPLNLSISNTVIPLGTFTTSSTHNSWEFPLLAKYRFHSPLIRPFLEAGPSFRHVQPVPGAGNLATTGFTAGGGVEFKFGPLRLDPEVRYTRWGSDSSAASGEFITGSNVNQAELLLGLSF